MKQSDVFTVDHGRQLANVILHINWKYHDAFEKTGRDDEVERCRVSMRMIEIQRRWNEEIAAACQQMMAHISQTVAEFQRIAADALAAVPPRLQKLDPESRA